MTGHGVAVAAAGGGVATISDIETIPGVVAPPRAPTLAEGAQFHGRYTIEREIGAGAMGVVYVAQDQVTRRPVALKLITPALAERPSARERFLREGLMARDVRHPNIVAMYDVGEADGQIYLVMEHLGGETLRKWLHRTLQSGRDLPFDVARRIIRNVLEGLAAAHAVGVVHRDLKPENVMLTGDPHEGDCSLKILDFGIARVVGQGTPVQSTTATSSTGTPLYMAPEQKTAADTVGPPADLYAVTAMLYELLIGVAPEGRWRPPSKERDDIPAAVDALIEKGLGSRPRSRFQRAEEYIEALDAIGASPPLHLQPQVPPPAPPVTSAPPRTWQVPDWLKSRYPAWTLWKRMSTRQRAVVGTLMAIIGVGIAAATFQPPPTGRDDGAVTTTQSPTGSKATVPTTVPPDPPPVTYVNLAGRWSDELTGTRVAAGIVDISQNAAAISGRVFDTFGNQIGTVSGAVQEANLQYAYRRADGRTGTGRGQLHADGVHLSLEVRDDATGLMEYHTLHRNHLPNHY